MIRADARSMQLRSHTAPASANPSVAAAAAFAGAGAEAPPATMALNAPATPGVGGTGSGGGPPLSPVASFSSMSSGRGIAPRPRAKGNQVATHIIVGFVALVGVLFGLSHVVSQWICRSIACFGLLLLSLFLFLPWHILTHHPPNHPLNGHLQ